MKKRKKFLTSYDYAQGGIWLYIEADSPVQITKTYRDLTVHKVPPPWWSASTEEAAQSLLSDPFWNQWLSNLKR
jgi:hypothetical protein